MSAPAEPARRGLGTAWLVAGTVGYVLVAPVGMVALPLSAAVYVGGGRSRREVLSASVAAGIGVYWLLMVGDPPDQVVRAGALIATVVFVVLARFTDWGSLTDRALTAVALGALGITSLVATLPMSWPAVRWWVEYRIGLAVDLLMTPMRLRDPTVEPASSAMGVQFEDWMTGIAPTMADYFAATTALQMLVGLALATALYRRVTAGRAGAMGAPRRFRDLRFSHHWTLAAVIPLAVVLTAKAASVKLAAANLLVVSGALYAIRGAAVAWFGMAMVGGPGLFLSALIAFAIIFMLPVVAAGAVILGVVDAGLDLRRRWATPPTRD